MRALMCNEMEVVPMTKTAYELESGTPVSTDEPGYKVIYPNGTTEWISAVDCEKQMILFAEDDLMGAAERLVGMPTHCKVELMSGRTIEVPIPWGDPQFDATTIEQAITEEAKTIADHLTFMRRFAQQG